MRQNHRASCHDDGGHDHRLKKNPQFLQLLATLRQEEGAAADEEREQQRHEECGEQAEQSRHRETGMTAQAGAGDLVFPSRLENLRRKQRDKHRPQRAGDEEGPHLPGLCLAARGPEGLSSLRNEGDRDPDGERREQQKPASPQRVDDLVGPRRNRRETLGHRLPKRPDHGPRRHIHGLRLPQGLLLTKIAHRRAGAGVVSLFQDGSGRSSI